MDGNDLYNDADYDEDSDDTTDYILVWSPFWFATYEKVYKSRDRRYFIQRKDIENDE